LETIEFSARVVLAGMAGDGFDRDRVGEDGCAVARGWSCLSDFGFTTTGFLSFPPRYSPHNTPIASNNPAPALMEVREVDPGQWSSDAL
jgi:hypothetical protein